MSESKDNKSDSIRGVNSDENKNDTVKNSENKMSQHDVDSTTLNDEIDGRIGYNNSESSSKSKLEQSIQDTKDTVSKMKSKPKKYGSLTDGGADFLVTYNDVKAEKENDKIGYTKDRGNKLDKLTDKVKKFTDTETEGSYDNKYTVRNIKINLAKKLVSAYFTTSGKLKLFWAFMTSGLGLSFLGAIFTFILLILTSVVLVSGVAIVMLTGEDKQGSNISEVKSKDSGTSSSVDVPKGYEGKIMYPITTLSSARGINSGHTGMDIGGQPSGEKVYPIYPGKVLLSGKGKPQCPNTGGNPNCQTILDPSNNVYFTGDGNSIQVVHDLGKGKYLISYYMHLAPGSIKVKEGQSVGYGTEMAEVGNSGNSYGHHLHLELYDDVPKEFYSKGKVAYKSIPNSYGYMISRVIAPAPLFTCGGKSGVVANNGGSSTLPKSCLDDALKARKK